MFSQLVVDFARKHGARTMVKGLRVIADFEWEFQMNRLNHRLAPEVETMYVMSSPEFAFVSSSGVKEIASFGGNVEGLVTPMVAKRFRELYPNGRPGPPLSPDEKAWGNPWFPTGPLLELLARVWPLGRQSRPPRTAPLPVEASESAVATVTDRPRPRPALPAGRPVALCRTQGGGRGEPWVPTSVREYHP